MFTRIKTDKEIEAMRESGAMLASVLKLLKSELAVGISTKELADKASQELKALGGKPAFLGYQGFPDVLCASVNDEVVHGIPDPSKVLKESDVVGLDFGVIYKGMITDAAISLIVGKATAAASNLVKTTERALNTGIDQVKDGAHVGDIAYAIQEVLEKANFGIVKDFVGHGVGHELHEDPNIPNFGSKGSGKVLSAGMTIAIEPMATLGGEAVYIDPDGWTVKTRDSSLAAHFEHTVLITENGAEILTAL